MQYKDWKKGKNNTGEECNSDELKEKEREYRSGREIKRENSKSEVDRDRKQHLQK